MSLPDVDWASFCRRAGIRYLILYGSRVHGRPDALSDWDFAARWGRRPSPLELGELAARLAELIGDERVDILVLDSARIPPPLLYEVYWRGRPLCILDRELYLWDKVRALSLYQEYRILFRPLALKMVEELAKRGVVEEGEEVQEGCREACKAAGEAEGGAASR